MRSLNDILAAIEANVNELRQTLTTLQDALTSGPSGSGPRSVKKAAAKRHISEEGRERLRKRMRQLWAQKRAAKKAAGKKAAKKSVPAAPKE